MHLLQDSKHCLCCQMPVFVFNEQESLLLPSEMLKYMAILLRAHELGLMLKRLYLCVLLEVFVASRTANQPVCTHAGNNQSIISALKKMSRYTATPRRPASTNRVTPRLQGQASWKAGEVRDVKHVWLICVQAPHIPIFLSP